MMDASTTLRFSTPTTRHCSSTTVVGSEAEPILHVHDGWYAVSDLALDWDWEKFRNATYKLTHQIGIWVRLILILDVPLGHYP